MSIVATNIEFTFNGQDISKALTGFSHEPVYSQLPHPGLGYIGRSGNLRATLNVYFAKQRAVADWQRFNAAYQVPDWRPRKGSKPKWGQPGRRRRRKMRMEARRHNENMQRQRAAVDLLERAQRAEADAILMAKNKLEQRIMREAFASALNPPREVFR